MAYIGHLCACGDMDVSHARTATGRQAHCTANANNPCGRPCQPNPEPMLRPTFNLARQQVARIVPPGDRLGGTAINTVRTCDCDARKALYAELSAA